MAQTCRYCGSPLEVGRPCTCKAAVKARSRQPANGEQVVFEFPKTGVQLAEEYGRHPAEGDAPGEEASPPRAAVPLSQKLERLNLKNTLREVLAFGAGLLRDPAGVAKNAKHISPAAAFTALGLQALFFMLCMWMFMRRLLAAGLGGFTAGAAVPGRAVVYFLLAALLEYVWLYAALFVICKIKRSSVSMTGLLGTVALSAPLWSAVFLLILILLLPLGVGAVSVCLYAMLLLFAQAYSLYALGISMRGHLPVGCNSHLLVSAAYAVHAGVVIRLVAAMLGSIAPSAWY